MGGEKRRDAEVYIRATKLTNKKEQEMTKLNHTEKNGPNQNKPEYH